MGGSEVLVVQNINVECILNLDTTIKVGDGGVCFTLGGTRNIPVIVADDEPICIESAQANAGIMRGGCPTLNASPEANKLRAALKSGYDEWDDEEE